MPATSDKQRRFMGMELAAKRAGKPTQTKMSEQQLADFAAATLEPKRPKQPRKPQPTQPNATTDKEPWER
jgi:hypothetical protein